MSQAVQTSKHL